MCVESGLVLRIPQATLGVSTDLLSTPISCLFNIFPWQCVGGVGTKKIMSFGGSFQLRPDSTVSFNGLWNIALVEGGSTLTEVIQR